ncbi:MAG: FHA domain-containing protein [Chloroflexota bacterium]
MKKKPWNRFEAFAQRLVEGSFHNFFGTQTFVERHSVQLAEAIESHQINGRLPNQITLKIQPDVLKTAVSEMQSLAELEQAFYTAIIELAKQLQIQTPNRLTVQILEANPLADEALQIEFAQQVEKEHSTQVHKRPFANSAELEAIKTVDAFLIITGQKHILLNKPLISLGRSLENDVVLDAATISRKHAQIRWRLGRFVLYDLSKKGRTVVNGTVVTEHVLEPGDVIVLSKTKIVYGEGATRPNVIKKHQAVDDHTRPMDKLDL